MSQTELARNYTHALRFILHDAAAKDANTPNLHPNATLLPLEQPPLVMDYEVRRTCRTGAERMVRARYLCQRSPPRAQPQTHLAAPPFTDRPIRHVVAFRFKEDAPVEELINGYAVKDDSSSST